MSFFNKERSKSAENVPILIFTARQLSITFAALLGLFFFVFIAGYFLGKKNAAEQLLYKIEQESLADQIYSSMCILSDKDENENNEASESGEVSEKDQAETAESNESEEEENQVMSSVDVIENKQQYQAQLAGFSNEITANRFAEKLRKKGYAVEVVTRYSIGSKQQKVAWYQVVTKKYEQKSELIAVVNQIKKSEHLHNDVKIVQA